MSAEIPTLAIAGRQLPLAVAAPLIVALCTAAVRLAWAGTSAALRRVRFFLDQVIVECPIKLTWLDKQLDELKMFAPLYCLLVRFGSDDYLTKMASDQERFEGRLQNRVIHVDRDASQVILSLPVHKRMGTQFKLYFLAPSVTHAVKLYQQLKIISNEANAGTSDGHQIILDEDEPSGRKVWFRLKAYGLKETVDKYQNNYFSSSQIKGFEERNALAPSRWSRRTAPEDEQ